jgi:hypothetical protein
MFLRTGKQGKVIEMVRKVGNEEMESENEHIAIGLDQSAFKDAAMSILRDEAVLKNGPLSTKIWSDMSWMWTVVNRISSELVDRRMSTIMDEGKAPFLLQIARLERMVRVQRSEIDLMDETITKRGNLLEVKNVELLVLHHRLQVGSDV